MTYALKFAKAAPAIAMSYLSVVWGLLGGYIFFHEVVSTAQEPLFLSFPCPGPLVLCMSTACMDGHNHLIEQSVCTNNLSCTQYQANRCCDDDGLLLESCWLNLMLQAWLL